MPAARLPGQERQRSRSEPLVLDETSSGAVPNPSGRLSPCLGGRRDSASRIGKVGTCAIKGVVWATTGKPAYRGMRVGQGTHGGEARLGARPALGPHQIVRAVAARSKTVDRPGRCRFITFGVMWGGETCPNQTPPPGPQWSHRPRGRARHRSGWHRVCALSAIKAPTR
jgi:hypothetical protein